MPAAPVALIDRAASSAHWCDAAADETEFLPRVSWRRIATRGNCAECLEITIKHQLHLIDRCDNFRANLLRDWVIGRLAARATSLTGIGDECIERFCSAPIDGLDAPRKKIWPNGKLYSGDGFNV